MDSDLRCVEVAGAALFVMGLLWLGRAVRTSSFGRMETRISSQAFLMPVSSLFRFCVEKIQGIVCLFWWAFIVEMMLFSGFVVFLVLFN